MFKKISVSLLLTGACVAYAEQTCDTSVENNTPTADFVNHQDGTVTQKSSGLMWSVCSLGQNFEKGECQGKATKLNWQNAMQAAKKSQLAGYDNWRLPSIDELNLIVEIGCHNPAINLQVFPNTIGGGYWSASTVARVKKNARAMFFFYGEDSSFYKKTPYFVRLVRTP